MVYAQNLKGKECLLFAIILDHFLLLELFGISFFRDSQIGILLLITHILSAITIGIIFGLKDRLKKGKILNRSLEITHNICTFSNLGEILSNSIKNALITVGLIRWIYYSFFCNNIYFRRKPHYQFFMHFCESDL